ncbi:hypothetical protein EDD22DRAFT_845588 [Suillus occidentalis]|nr:hypothetical protein EDD22DRAFT_845588 [Suillus occidentalis]
MTRAKAAATRQSARLVSVGANVDDNSAPQSNAPKVTPLPSTPAARAAAAAAAKPVAKPATKPAAKQPSKQPAPASTPSAPSLLNPPAVAPMQQTVDVAALLSQIAQLEQEQAARTVQPIELPHKALAPMLFASPDEVKRARVAIIKAKKDEPKVSLSNVVPGFKANPLDTDLSYAHQGSSDAAAHPSALDFNTELKASASYQSDRLNC